MQNILGVKKIHKNSQLPEKNEVGDWIDLYNNSSCKMIQENGNDEMSEACFVDLEKSDMDVKSGETVKISFGVGFEIPFGYSIELVERSGTFRKYGLILANSVGCIDQTYKGEVSGMFFATRDTKVKFNERLVQFKLIKQEIFKIKEISELSNSLRGAGGYGSTGR